MENKRKHLEMIQGVINRLAGNTFFLRGWAITLIAALFALAAKDTNLKYILIAYFPVVSFWILDGYFLSQERLFRRLYDKVRKFNEKDINFSMDTKESEKNDKDSWLNSIFSPTLLGFYLPLIAIMLVIMFLIN